jgi:hypothetical protein
MLRQSQSLTSHAKVSAKDINDASAARGLTTVLKSSSRPTATVVDLLAACRTANVERKEGSGSLIRSSCTAKPASQNARSKMSGARRYGRGAEAAASTVTSAPCKSSSQQPGWAPPTIDDYTVAMARGVATWSRCDERLGNRCIGRSPKACFQASSWRPRLQSSIGWTWYCIS